MQNNFEILGKRSQLLGPLTNATNPNFINNDKLNNFSFNQHLVKQCPQKLAYSEQKILQKNYSFSPTENFYKKISLSRSFAFPIQLESQLPISQRILDLSHNDSMTKIDTIHQFETVVAYSSSQVIFWNYKNQQESIINCSVKKVICCKIERECAYFLIVDRINLATLYYLKRDMTIYNSQEMTLLPLLEFFAYNESLNGALCVPQKGLPFILLINTKKLRTVLIPLGLESLGILKRIKCLNNCLLSKKSHGDHKFIFTNKSLAHLKTTFFSNQKFCQTIYFYKQEKSAFVFLSKLRVSEIIKQNISAFQTEKDLVLLGTSNLFVSDFAADFDSQKVNLLFKHGFELSVEMSSGFVKSAFRYQLNLESQSVPEFLQYFSKSKILVLSQQRLYLIHKNLSAAFDFDSVTQSSCSLAEFPEDINPDNSCLIYSAKQSKKELFEKSRKLICFEQNKLRFFRLLADSDCLANLVIFEIDNRRNLSDLFSKLMVKIAYEIKLSKFCKILIGLVFSQRPRIYPAYLKTLSVLLPNQKSEEIDYENYKFSPELFHDQLFRYLLVFELFEPSLFDRIFENRLMSDLITVRIDESVSRKLFEAQNENKSRRSSYVLEITEKEFKNCLDVPLLTEQTNLQINQILICEIQKVNLKVDFIKLFFANWNKNLGLENNFLEKTNAIKFKVFEGLGLKSQLDSVVITEENLSMEQSLASHVNDMSRVFKLVVFLPSVLQLVPTGLINELRKKVLRDFIGNEMENDLLKRILLSIYFSSSKMETNIFSFYFEKTQIKEIEKVHFALLSNTEEQLFGEISGLKLLFLTDLYLFFVVKNRRPDFMKMILNRLNEIVTILTVSNIISLQLLTVLNAEKEQIEHFVMCMLVLLLTERKPIKLSVNQKIQRFIMYLKSKIKSKFVDEINVDKFDLLSFEEDLNQLDVQQKQTLFAVVFPVIMKSKSNKLRENTLQLILEFNKTNMLNTVESVIPTADFVNLLENADVEQYELINKSNINFIMYYLFSNKLYETAIKTILKVVGKHSKHFLLHDFLKIDFEDFVIVKSESVNKLYNDLLVFISKQKLHTFSSMWNWLVKAQESVLFLSKTQPKNSVRYFEEIATLIDNFKANKTLADALLEKKDQLEKCAQVSFISIEQEMFSRILMFLDLTINYLEFNIKIPKDTIFKHVVEVFKLPMIDLPETSLNKPVFKQITRVLKEKGVVSTFEESRFLKHHFTPKNKPQSLKSESDLPIQNAIKFSEVTFFEISKQISHKKISELAIFYPENLTESFRESLAKFIKIGSCEEVEEIMRIVESFNNISQISRIKTAFVEKGFTEKLVNNNWFLDLLQKINPPEKMLEFLIMYNKNFDKIQMEENPMSISVTNIRRVYSVQIFQILNRILNYVCSLLNADVLDNYYLRFFVDNLHIAISSAKLAEKTFGDLKFEENHYFVFKNKERMNNLKVNLDKIIRDPRIQQLKKRII